MDPFCGSGTILIEAAWIALGVPPGIWRPFAFERLRNHDEEQWHKLKEDARSHIAPTLESPIVGYDLDPQAIASAHENLERAGLDANSVRFEVGDARDVPPPASSGWLVTNPPYGERLSHDDDNLWRPWSQNLKQNYSGWKINIISSDRDLPRALRLKPYVATPYITVAWTVACSVLKWRPAVIGTKKPQASSTPSYKNLQHTRVYPKIGLTLNEAFSLIKY